MDFLTGDLKMLAWAVTTLSCILNMGRFLSMVCQVIWMGSRKVLWRQNLVYESAATTNGEKEGPCG